ncbi:MULTISPECIES: succinyl-CoA synthetase subunit beta [Marinobacter]|uniref:succinyl-CoA synthetase subunit beta n=1 Tax=Marinobacter TaxID=2742 RepID=UPI001246B6E7|nr:MULTISPECIES: succinyl-CoA synthetase subunit beta [Marinobacter]MBL3555138.1 succinyl-CoA synthetase subunit beta [Marinobacter sp. JB05H06]
MGINLALDLPARKARIWQYLALAGIVLIAPFFFIGGPGWTDGPLYKSAWNLGHILFFALLTLAIQPWRFWTGWKLWGLATLAVLLVGLGIELLQYGTSRQMDGQDLFRNLLGLWIILLISPGVTEPSRSGLGTWSLRIAIAALLVAETGATAAVALQQYRVSQLLPELYDFSQSDPSPFWSGAIAAADVAGPQNGLRLSLSTAHYSGATLHNFPSDWQGYGQLVMSLDNPQDQPVHITLRINDIQHDQGDNDYSDRFNTRLTLSPGPNTFQLDLDRIKNAPATRAMNMREVRRLKLFTTGLPSPKTVYLRDLRLK